ncbi:MAG: M28 family peptidase, partial [Bacteroidota bacterium]
MRNYSCILLLICLSCSCYAQETPPPSSDSRIYDIVKAVSADRIEKDIRKLVSFGTRHTLSDTVSDTRGIGAARRWIKSEFENISEACGGCLDVSYQFSHVKGNPRSRIKEDAIVVNVLATLRGSRYPNRYVIMSGDIDSRVSDALNATDDSPGANDNASGMAGVLEAARVLSQYEFPSNIIFVGLSGEEQGLFGGKHMAKVAKEKEWDIVGVLNNDMIGNIEGIDGVIQNNSFRVFSEPTPVT